MGLTFLTFISIFTLIASAGLLLFNRQRRARISSVFANPYEGVGFTSSLNQATASLGEFVGRFEGAVPKSQKDVSVVRRRLIHAGFREDDALKVFYGAKFVLMVVLTGAALGSGIARLNYFMVITFALGAGFLVPDFWLGRRIKQRQKEIRRELPDVLDLLIVCVEAGLSIDQATIRAAQEMAISRSAIANELEVVILEQRAGCPRTEAWKHFAERTDVDCVRAIVSMLVQADQFGTSIAKTLRVYSQTMRTQRIQQIEEQAAKTGIKILFPLVLFIFPNLFLVVLGPPVLMMLDTLRSNFNH
jgi:tight adherence protein C